MSQISILELLKKNSNTEDVATAIKSYLEKMSGDERIQAINEIRVATHEVSPFVNEPVDLVLWVKNDAVYANDYNPNKVAPPEMELLRVSINNDGYTQPIVTMPDKEGKREVIDGFHRNRVGKECKDIQKRVNGYLPVVSIRKSQAGKSDRIASTIRHNRARGKHQVDAMSEIVIELKNRNWKNARISKELGMDEEEILRLCQITGLQGLFNNEDFTKSWEIGGSEDEYKYLTEDISDEEKKDYRTVNTSDPDRIFHTYDKWECYKAGLYDTKPPEGMSNQDCEESYYEVLTDSALFAKLLDRIINEWKNSCEHYLTNKAMNRILWLGQAAVCMQTKVSSKYCTGWNLLNYEQQEKANSVANEYLNKWLVANKMEEVSVKEGLSQGRQVNIY